MADILLLKKAFIAPIRFYQRFISPYTPKSCRYYPTCSEYATQQFTKNTLFKAFFLSIFRILRCNQLFAGGIDYPIVDFKKPLLLYVGKRKQIIWWYVPLNDTKAVLIKQHP